MDKENIIIKDPLYKQILFSSRHKKFLDSKEFQRLRNIKQTSFVEQVYPSANHTRFTHSLGAYHLMRKVITNKEVKIPTEEKDNLVLAALLHDIGHGPFSHAWEKVFPHFDHEKATIEILKKFKLKGVIDIIEKKSKFSPLITSTIDVDKLDYMARDSYFAGVSYGVSEVDFIIQHMYIKDGNVTIKPSALSSVEDLITQRVNLFKTVYFHKTAVMYDFLFVNIFKRVKELLKKGEVISVNKNLLKFFNKENTIEDLLALNDIIIINQIYEWANSKDKVLSEFCNCFISRRKFKVFNLAHNKINVSKVKREVSKKYDLSYYFALKSIPINILQTPIYVEFKDKIVKLEECSELIKFYKKQNWKLEFLIIPSDIKI